MPKNTLVSKIMNSYFNINLAPSAQSFNLLGFGGIVTGIIAASSAVLTNAGKANVFINLLASFLAFVLLVLTRKNLLSYRTGSWIIVTAVFLLAFPILFFTAGGYRSGMPCFFLFAVIYTAFMLEKREQKVAIGIEFVSYVTFCLIAYIYPQTVTYFETELDYVLDILTGFVISGTLLLIVVLLHIKIYRNRQRIIDELNLELEARNQALIKHNRMKSDFLATVSHEISKPLAVISASSSDTIALLEELPNIPKNMDEILKNHETIERRVRTLDRVITDLMDTVAIETGRLPLSRKKLKLSLFLKNICDIHFKELDKNKNRLIYDFQPDLPLIWADPERIEQVMTNLISNAVRHTHNGEIIVKLTKTKNNQTISVSDNGEGMDTKISEVVMKQYAPSVHGDYWRHGFGLFLCRQIVVSHGGDIRIESEKGKGTKISFTLNEEKKHE
jgi:signal transduction histidine kinase